MWPSIVSILVMTAICTLTGGLTAVIYMDTFQCALMLGGACLLAVKAFMEVSSKKIEKSVFCSSKVGGYSGLVDSYMHAVANTTLNTSLLAEQCGLPNKKAFTLLREPTDADYPWPGFIFGQTPSSIWYWAADQVGINRKVEMESIL